MTFKGEPGTNAREKLYKESSMKIYYIILLVSLLALSITIASAGLFGPDPTPTPEPQPTIADTWTPIDKCWTYQPDTWEVFYSYSSLHYGQILYFITYVNQNGHHKIEQVDIDTWYDFNVYLVNQNTYMFHQGS